jgi:hypothetical protein
VLTHTSKEPTKRVFAAEYMERLSLKSTGGIQRNLSMLTGEDLVEQSPTEGARTAVDSLLRQCLAEKAMWGGAFGRGFLAWERQSGSAASAFYY